MAAAAAKPLPSIRAEDADNAFLIDDAFCNLSGIDIIAHDAEFVFAIVRGVSRSKCPRRAVAIRDDKGRRNLDVGLGFVLALIASAVDHTRQDVLVEKKLAHGRPCQMDETKALNADATALLISVSVHSSAAVANGPAVIPTIVPPAVASLATIEFAAAALTNSGL
jgi:hypothetical protein